MRFLRLKALRAALLCAITATLPRVSWLGTSGFTELKKPGRSRCRFARNAIPTCAPCFHHQQSALLSCSPKLKRRSPKRSPFARFAPGLECLNVFRLPALGTLGHIELHRLALLQALEAARLDR